MAHLIFVEQCASTNDEILSFLLQNPFDFFGVFTLNQTKGRGQYGNSWQNTAGKNLAFTIAIKSESSFSANFINFCTAVFLRRFVAKLTSKNVKIKWPNDLILNQKKIAGILIEKKKIQDTEYFIIGIGLNVLQENFDGLKSAGSLYSETGNKYNPEKIALDLFDFLKLNFDNPESFDEILSDYNHHLFGRNTISVFEKNGIRQNGIIKEMDKDGFLWIELENDGLEKFFHKEIQMLY